VRETMHSHMHSLTLGVQTHGRSHSPYGHNFLLTEVCGSLYFEAFLPRVLPGECVAMDWRTTWPHIRRALACLDRHPQLDRWPVAKRAIMRSTGLPDDVPIPVATQWATFAETAEVCDAFPDFILMTKRSSCDCC
jgi:hypothetical protein